MQKPAVVALVATLATLGPLMKSMTATDLNSLLVNRRTAHTRRVARPSDGGGKLAALKARF
jgi:hypothetical protein